MQSFKNRMDVVRFLTLHTSLAAAFWTFWSLSSKYWGQPESKNCTTWIKLVLRKVIPSTSKLLWLTKDSNPIFLQDMSADNDVPSKLVWCKRISSSKETAKTSNILIVWTLTVNRVIFTLKLQQTIFFMRCSGSQGCTTIPNLLGYRRLRGSEDGHTDR